MDVRAGDPNMESWKSAVKGQIIVRQFDVQGKLRGVTIPPGRTFHISSQERRINQELAANEELDVFQNGMLQPVRLIEDTAEAQEIASNPNFLSDSDLTALVKSHANRVASKVSEIKNPVVLHRLLEAAVANDATVSVVQKIKDRIAEVAPNVADEIVQAGPDPRGENMNREFSRPVTTR